MIHVGFREVDPRELGFESHDIILVHESDVKPVYVHVLKRHNEPMVLISERKTIRIAQLSEAYTRYLDYPTKPFIRALEILKQQEEDFLEKIAEVYRGDANILCCSAVGFIADIAGILEFALKMRGENITISIGCVPFIAREKIVEIEKALRRIDETAPSIGNRTYIDIAHEAYNMLKVTTSLVRLLYEKGGIFAGCACNC